VTGLFNNTTVFPIKSRKSIDTMLDDGYVISEENKTVIDRCSLNNKEMLFLKDLPETVEMCDPERADLDIPLCYLIDYERHNVLAYCSAAIQQHGNGWGVSFTFASLTSVMAYLIELGAGIGCSGRLITLDLNALPVQLLVGASDEFLNFHRDEASHHVLSYHDLIKFYRQIELNNDDIARLKNQAETGLRYGHFEPNIERELCKIKRILPKLGLFSDRQLQVYAEFNEELLTIILQAMHQYANNGFPREMMHIILCSLTGLSMAEIASMTSQVIGEHERAFPATISRR
jgi:hypothetical protein